MFIEEHQLSRQHSSGVLCPLSSAAPAGRPRVVGFQRSSLGAHSIFCQTLALRVKMSCTLIVSQRALALIIIEELA
jgi:hypothetical protein